MIAIHEEPVFLAARKIARARPARELSPSINVAPDDGVSRSVERADTNVCFAKHLGRGIDGAARTAGERERTMERQGERERERESRPAGLWETEEESK